MTSRRIAETTTAGIVTAAAATVTVALVVPHLRSAAPPPPPEPEIYCVIPAVAPIAPDCTSPTGPFPSTIVPADVARPARDVNRTDSGLAYRVLSYGCGGPSPDANDEVELRYIAWNAKGKDITGGVQTGHLPLAATVPGFREGVTRMHVGDRVRLWIPAHLAYERTRDPEINGTLTFDVELVSLSPKP
jgi:hypothetical protein